MLSQTIYEIAGMPNEEPIIHDIRPDNYMNTLKQRASEHLSMPCGPVANIIPHNKSKAREI
jgi:hypothetical protein